jgi:hypothetical protein
MDRWCRHGAGSASAHRATDAPAIGRGVAVGPLRACGRGVPVLLDEHPPGTTYRAARPESRQGPWLPRRALGDGAQRMAATGFEPGYRDDGLRGWRWRAWDSRTRAAASVRVVRRRGAGGRLLRERRAPRLVVVAPVPLNLAPVAVPDQAWAFQAAKKSSTSCSTSGSAADVVESRPDARDPIPTRTTSASTRASAAAHQGTRRFRRGDAGADSCGSASSLWLLAIPTPAWSLPSRCPASRDPFAIAVVLLQR